MLAPFSAAVRTCLWEREVGTRHQANCAFQGPHHPRGSRGSLLPAKKAQRRVRSPEEVLGHLETLIRPCPGHCWGILRGTRKLQIEPISLPAELASTCDLPRSTVLLQHTCLALGPGQGEGAVGVVCHLLLWGSLRPFETEWEQEISAPGRRDKALSSAPQEVAICPSEMTLCLY